MSIADQKSNDVRDKSVEVSAFSCNLKARDRWFEPRLYFTDGQTEQARISPALQQFIRITVLY
jgi:hypothetical protein